MLPLRDVIPSRTTPWIAIIVIAAYIVAALSSAIAHTGWPSVIGNVVPLWVFGETLEDRLGHGRFLVFLAIGAALATAAFSWVAPDAPRAIVTVTGAVAAVIGGYLSLFPKSRVLVFVYAVVFADAVEVPALVILALWAVLHAVSLDAFEAARLGRALLAAQLGGLAAGAATVWVFRRKERMKTEWWNRASG